MVGNCAYVVAKLQSVTPNYFLNWLPWSRFVGAYWVSCPMYCFLQHQLFGKVWPEICVDWVLLLTRLLASSDFWCVRMSFWVFTWIKLMNPSSWMLLAPAWWSSLALRTPRRSWGITPLLLGTVVWDCKSTIPWGAKLMMSRNGSLAWLVNRLARVTRDYIDTWKLSDL